MNKNENNMKKILKIYIVTLSIVIMIVYLFGWIDLIGNYPEMNFQNKFIYSFEYFFTNVIPYWWFLILILSFGISGIIFLVTKKAKTNA